MLLLASLDYAGFCLAERDGWTRSWRGWTAELIAFVKIADPAVVRVLCSVPGLQGLILDAEHGAFAERDLETLCALINLSGKLSVIRAPDSSARTLSRLLDRGAKAVMIPQVRTSDEVREAVMGAHYAPVGARGFDPNVSATSYGAAIENPSPRIIVQIETEEALADVTAIASVEFVTDVFVGPADLGRALNAPRGEIFAPVVIEAIETVARSVNRNGLRLGTYVDSVERAEWAASLGYSLLAVGTDASFMRSAAAGMTSAISTT